MGHVHRHRGAGDMVRCVRDWSGWTAVVLLILYAVYEIAVFLRDPFG